MVFFFEKWLQPVEISRKRLKKIYEVKFCFMQKEISYIRLKIRLSIKSLKIAIPYFSKYLSERKMFFLGSTIK